MLTLALYGLLAVLVIGALYLIAVRLLPAGEQIAPPVRDEPIWALPVERSLLAADVADVRLPVALRGYRFAETDLLLDRLVEELQARDEEIARLRGEAPKTRTGQPDPAPGARFQLPPGQSPEPSTKQSPEPPTTPSTTPSPPAATAETPSPPAPPQPAGSRPPAPPPAAAPTPADDPGKPGEHAG